MKQLTFSTKTLHSVLLILLPTLGKIIKEKELAFSYFHDIDSLFSHGLDLPPEETEKGFLGKIMPRLVKSISGDRTHVLRFETPETMSSQISILNSFYSFIYLLYVYLNSMKDTRGLDNFFNLIIKWMIKIKLLYCIHICVLLMRSSSVD